MQMYWPRRQFRPRRLFRMKRRRRLLGQYRLPLSLIAVLGVALGWTAVNRNLAAVARGDDGTAPVVLSRIPAWLYDRDCADFRTQAEAQRFFEAAGPGDPHGLDANHDGVACEGKAR